MRIDGQEELEEQEASGGDDAVVLALREPDRPLKPPLAIRQPSEPPESREATPKREERYRAILGIPEPKSRRRWRR
jgi:hypothetical protein